MKKVYSNLSPTVSQGSNALIAGGKGLFALACLLWAGLTKTPGVSSHWLAYRFALNLLAKGSLHKDLLFSLLFLPVDSIRYYEFAFLQEVLAKTTFKSTYLDVSSPRLVAARILNAHRNLPAIMVNPDSNDSAKTQALLKLLRLDSHCTFHTGFLDGMDLPSNSCNLITSISVLEHIPDEGDTELVQTLWQLLSTGGRLLISVPAAREPFEEFVNYDEYGLGKRDSIGYLFGQRFYDETLLAQRIFSITGPPRKMAVAGEKSAGFSDENRRLKLQSGNYPFWKEPLIARQHYRWFPDIDSLPGQGVVVMEFVKE